jgi:hypothetical protein
VQRDTDKSDASPRRHNEARSFATASGPTTSGASILGRLDEDDALHIRASAQVDEFLTFGLTVESTE